MTVELEQWKAGNPEGYERAVDETSSAYLETLNASRHDQNKPVLSNEEREKIKETLIDPDKTQRMNGELIETLSKDAIEWRDARYTHASNMSLADQLSNEMFDQEHAKDTVNGLQNSSKVLRRKHLDLGTDEEIAESHGHSIDRETLDLFKEPKAIEQQPYNPITTSPSSSFSL